MIKISGITFFAGAVVAVAAALGGCGSSSSSAPNTAIGALGESCGRTADCGSGLVCIEDTCVAKGTTVNDAGVVIGADGGIVVPPDAGSTPDSGIAVEAAPPHLGILGDTCTTTLQCGAGLSCIPTYPYGSSSGICDVTSFGITPSGKTCSGECNTGADCCELPLGVTINAIAIHTCQDILNSVLTGNTTQCTQAPTPTSPVGIGCFYYATYCSTCAQNNVWKCTNNSCVYNASCQNSGVEFEGCPAQTRTGAGTPTTNCDTMTNTCKPATALGICSVDSDCDGKGSSDAAGTCRGGACTCSNQACYFKCGSDLDCRQGYACNTTSHLCTRTAECSVDADCAQSTEIVTAKCSSGTCKVPCTTDHQCGGSGILNSGNAPAASYTNSYFGQVCGADGFCDDQGCSSDTDCDNSGSNNNVGNGTVHLFCVTKAAPAVTPVIQSAITN